MLASDFFPLNFKKSVILTDMLRLLSYQGVNFMCVLLYVYLNSKLPKNMIFCPHFKLSRNYD